MLITIRLYVRNKKYLPDINENKAGAVNLVGPIVLGGLIL